MDNVCMPSIDVQMNTFHSSKSAGDVCPYGYIMHDGWLEMYQTDLFDFLHGEDPFDSDDPDHTISRLASRYPKFLVLC